MILLVHGDREYLRAPGDELHTDLGMLTVPEDVEAGQTLEAHIGKEFLVREPRGPDLFNHFERTGVPMMPRDISLTVDHTGVAAGEYILDTDTGTGALSAYFGRLNVDVTTFERDAEFTDMARENMRLASVEQRVDVRIGNITDELDDLADSGFGTLTLDTENTPEVVRHAPDLLVTGSYVAVYSPFVEGTRATVEAARETGLSDVETFETIQRQMGFNDHGSRPSTAGVGHTGYLVFACNKRTSPAPAGQPLFRPDFIP